MKDWKIRQGTENDIPRIAVVWESAMVNDELWNWRFRHDLTCQECFETRIQRMVFQMLKSCTVEVIEADGAIEAFVVSGHKRMEKNTVGVVLNIQICGEHDSDVNAKGTTEERIKIFKEACEAATESFLIPESSRLPIQVFATHPASQRQGMATKLVDLVKEQARGSRCAVTVLSSAAAERFYGKLGFNVVSRHDVAGARAEIIVMALDYAKLNPM